MAKHIIVIGGGMAGTSAAHRLMQLGYAVTIIEKNNRLGGRVHSHLVQGTAVEMGAGFLTKTYTNLLEFLHQSGLSAKLRPQHSPTGIYKNGRVIMTSAQTVLGNQVLSWGAKFRALPLLARTLMAWPNLDTHASYKAAKYDDRTVSGMFTGKAGNELLEYVLQPILNGYFYWTPEHTSRAMMLILVKEAFSHGTYRLGGGLQQIPEKLAEGSKILLEHIVETVSYANGHYTITATSQGKRKSLTADGIVCTTTASVVPKIFPNLTDAQQQFFSSIEYSSGALIARTYEARHTAADRSIAFPRAEDVELSSITLSHETADRQAELATAKTYASGTSAKRFGALSDDQLTKRLIEEMEPGRSSVLHEDSEPLATHIQRWPEALPYFDAGHFKRLRQFENGEIEDRSQQLVFAGDYIGGPFMEGAFTSGLKAAERLDKRLGNAS